VSAPTLLPVFLRLEGRKVLVVGGGAVAASRVPSLLAAGADVSVVAPEVRYEIERMAVRVERRPFRPADVDGAWLVVAAAPPDVNRAAGEAAGARGVFVNAVDDPAAATVYTGGVLRRGGVTIAVSTEGRAPALAGLVREALEAVLPDDVSSWVGLASALRTEQRAARLPMSRRRPLLLEALNRLYSAERAASGREPAGAERGAVPA
jgi:uroporphyrin-III C-methyltransferase/precorrin-2 dehydrogenase/sirohydrochlorin ferrochelatase